MFKECNVVSQKPKSQVEQAESCVEAIFVSILRMSNERSHAKSRLS